MSIRRLFSGTRRRNRDIDEDWKELDAPLDTAFKAQQAQKNCSHLVKNCWPLATKELNFNVMAPPVVDAEYRYVAGDADRQFSEANRPSQEQLYQIKFRLRVWREKNAAKYWFMVQANTSLPPDSWKEQLEDCIRRTMLKEFSAKEFNEIASIWLLEGYSYEMSPQMADVLDVWAKKTKDAKVSADERAKVEHVLESIDGDLWTSFDPTT